MSAFLFARRRLPSDKVTSQPDSCVHLSAPRLLSQSPRGRPEFVDRWPSGVRGRQGRMRPRAAAKCYLLTQKSLSVPESLNSNQSDLKIPAAVIDLFYALIVSLDDKRCNWSPRAFFCPLSRCFHWSEKRMQGLNSRGWCEEAGPPPAPADQWFLLLASLQVIAPPC